MRRGITVKRRIKGIATVNVVHGPFFGLVPRVSDPADGGRITDAALLARPGWTPARISRFLGHPDEVLRDREDSMRLYSLRRILQAEAMWDAQVPA